MATYRIDNAPNSLSMNDFKSINEQFGGLAKTNRFVVRIIPQGRFLLRYGTLMNDLVYLTEIADIPGRGFMNVDVRYYGPNQKLPFQTTYEDLNITILCRNLSLEREIFDDWMTIINPINSFDFNYRDDYSSQIHIYTYDNTSTPNYHITMHNAYPLLINPQPVTWSDEQFQRLIVSFTYTHWTREKDPVPGRFSLVEGRLIYERTTIS